jgi:hypothetical protein
MISHLHLALTALFWKQSKLLHGRPLLVSECGTAMKINLTGEASVEKIDI